jgi:hypothetical protein
MITIRESVGFGRVEGLGDEEVPWWIAPYVRNFVALAKSSAVLELARGVVDGAHTPQPALAALTARLAQTAAFARVAAHITDGKQLAGGISGALAAEIDEYCGTPPRPHHVGQAALAVALLASSLQQRDPAKAVLVTEAERLQQMQQKLGGVG